MNLSVPIELDLTLARGLNYYTGAIFEVKAVDVQIGSICGGGRYDNLTGIFGLNSMSGVGISFGAERIFDVMNELGNFPENINTCKIMFVNFGEEYFPEIFAVLNTLRSKGISCMLYPEKAKLGKLFAYADDNNILFTAIIGESEKQSGKISLKNMTTGEQSLVLLEEMYSFLTK
jgi:histidyl-tRNA synthetase